jgi:hypothetical protein
MVRIASAASKHASRKGRAEATARTAGAAPGARWRIIVSDGSTATIFRRGGS